MTRANVHLVRHGPRTCTRARVLPDSRLARQRNFMTQTFRKILCPIDFDENSIGALETACKVAAQNDASLCIMHVVAIPAHATEMPPEALKPDLIWEREAKLKLKRIASERIPGASRSETLTCSGI
jgi:nucleotide-binding universal stress UspA family protein